MTEHKTIINLLFGNEGFEATLAFIFFAIAGMLFIKIIRYNKRKKELKGMPFSSPVKFDLRKWLDDNSIDFISAFLAAFFFFRFFPDAFTFINKFYELPESEDKMLYGLILGMSFQYISHKWMNSVTIENTIEKLIKQS